MDSTGLGKEGSVRPWGCGRERAGLTSPRPVAAVWGRKRRGIHRWARGPHRGAECAHAACRRCSAGPRGGGGRSGSGWLASPSGRSQRWGVGSTRQCCPAGAPCGGWAESCGVRLLSCRPRAGRVGSCGRQGGDRPRPGGGMCVGPPSGGCPCARVLGGEGWWPQHHSRRALGMEAWRVGGCRRPG